MTKDNKKPNVFARLADYLKGVRTELKRVTWPTRKEVLNSCVIVVVTLVFFSLFTTLVDSGATEVITLWGKVGHPAVEAPAEPADGAETTPTAEEEAPEIVVPAEEESGQ